MVAKYPLLIFVFIILTALQLGCVGSAHYFSPPSGTIEYGSGPVPVNPDKFMVDAGEYPVYEILNEFTPPKAEVCNIGVCKQLSQVEINTSDKWQVTHVFRNLYILESKSYSNRQCNYLAKHKVWGFNGFMGYCSATYEFGIYTTPDGSVSGGWAVLPGNTQIFSERQTYLNPDPRFNAGWPSGVIFKKTEATP